MAKPTISVYPETRKGKLTGRYYCEIRHNGARLRPVYDSKVAADATKAIYLRDGKLPESERPHLEDQGPTFEQVAEELEAAGGPGGTWAKGRDKSVTARLKFIKGTDLGQAPIKLVTYTMAEALVKNLRARPGQKGGKLSDQTLNNYLSPISAVLRYAVKKQYIAVAPDLPWIKRTGKKQPTYTEEQVLAVRRQLVESGFETEAFLMGVLSIAGPRCGEILARDANGKLLFRLDQVVIEANEDGTEDGWICFDDPERIKNKETTREAWIAPSDARKLRQLVLSNGVTKYDTMHKRLSAAIKKCGYDIPRPLHSLRHFAATTIANANDDITIAQTLLGHKSLATTKLYRHEDKKRMRDAAKKAAHARGYTEAEVVPTSVVQLKKSA